MGRRKMKRILEAIIHLFRRKKVLESLIIIIKIVRWIVRVILLIRVRGLWIMGSFLVMLVRNRLGMMVVVLSRVLRGIRVIVVWIIVILNLSNNRKFRLKITFLNPLLICFRNKILELVMETMERKKLNNK